MAAWAASNPLAFFALADLTARTATPWHLRYASVMLQIPNLLSPEGMQQFLPSWQHCKAYLSAFASWTKVYAKLLPAAAAEGPEAGQMLVFVMRQLVSLHNEIWQVTYNKASDVVLDLAGLLLVYKLGEGNKKLDMEYAATPRSIQLLLLVGMGKAVAATARELLGITVATSSSSSAGNGESQQQHPGSSSSSERVGGTSRGSGGVLGLGIGLSSCAGGRSGGIDTSSSSSGTGSAANRSSSNAGGYMEAGGEDDARSGAQSSSSSSSGGGHSRGRGSNSSGMVPGRIPGDVLTRAVQQFMMDTSSGGLGAALASASNLLTSPLAKTVVLGLMHFNCMAAWHKKVSEAAAAAAESKEGSASEGADAMHAKGPAAADQQQQHVPKRLAKLPQQGLPAAVVEQMEKISSNWPSKVLVQMQLPGEEAKQKQLLQDLLLLGHVLMVEVPTPVGCNNPGCMALGGVSEVEAAAKTCGGCRVARYCSQDCQRGHWKVHKETCQTLQQLLLVFEQEM